MFERVRARWIEIKYLLIGALILWGLIWLSRGGKFGGFEDHIVTLMDKTAAFGLVGLFIGAIIANATMVVSIPYTLLALTFFLVNSNVWDVVGFSLATGIGGGIGKLASYTLASNLAAQVESLSQSGLFRWIRRTIHRYPRLTPVVIFVGMVSALPNDMILLPMALIKYPVRRLALPLVAGKVIHSLGLAMVFVYVIGLTGDKITASVKVDLTFAVVLGTILMITYQIEKARAEGQTSLPAGTQA